MFRRDPVSSTEAAGTLVILPSLSFPLAELAKIKGIVHYEERLLCMLLLLRRPELRIVFITSQPVDPVVVDYYLSFLEDPAGAGRRLHLLSVGEAGFRPLADKLLDHPSVLVQVRELLAGGPPATLMPFNVTPAEEAVAETLGLPIDGARSDLAVLGSKTGARRAARRAGVAVMEGEEGLFSLDEVGDALGRLRAGGAHAAVVKLNNGFSGQGNALVDLSGPPRGAAETPTTFCATDESWRSFAVKIIDEGAIAERRASPVAASPSVQLRIRPGGRVELLSTHDQILGGPGGQVYLGCRFPASSSYRPPLTDAALRVAAVLAESGVVGPFGIDFLVMAGSDGFDIRLSEINLRMGGTTHPFWMARLVTGGELDLTTGRLLAEGRPLFYVATDNLTFPRLAGLAPMVAIEAVDRAGLAYCGGRGVTLHLLGALPGFGKVGATCIAGSRAEADELFSELSTVLEGAE